MSAINILSIRCSLAFVPYLAGAAAEFLDCGTTASSVVRQGGRGLIIRSDDGLILRHENRQVSLGVEDVRHYDATIRMRGDFYDVLRMPNEVILGTIGSETLLSHPQSDIWLSNNAVRVLSNFFESPDDQQLRAIPDWLTLSTGAGSLLLSDTRTGRWVLLGEDHACELRRRAHAPSKPVEVGATGTPPTISIKGLTLHMQSAFKLVDILSDYASRGTVSNYREETPEYVFHASLSTEGIELSDSDNRVALTAREARKWADILLEKLSGFKAQLFERGRIRTVTVESDSSTWVLQWGDELLISNEDLKSIAEGTFQGDQSGLVAGKQLKEFVVLLNPSTGSCVALTDSEIKRLYVTPD